MRSLASPGNYARRLFFLNGACAYSNDGNVDAAYVRRLLLALDGMRRGSKLLLFAFERAHGENGSRDDERTSFHVPDAYARQVAREHAR
jgi:mannonate dehydratase